MRSRRVRFSVRGMMTAIAVFALALFEARLAVTLLLGAFGVRAAWSLFPGGSGSPPRRWAGPYLTSLACLYLPFAWVLGDYPWDSYRWGWILLWPVLPGLIAGIFAHPNDAAMHLVSGVVAVLLVFLLTAVGALNHRALIAANGLALVGAGLESWLAYQLFLF